MGKTVKGGEEPKGKKRARRTDSLGGNEVRKLARTELEE